MTGEALRVCGYTRVSTQEQADSGLGIDAQRAAITAEAARRGWELLTIHEDAGLSGKSLNRPGLADALAMVEGDAASAIIVAKLDRLSRSLVDFAGLMQRAQRRGWQLVALDVNIDTTTAAGALVANVMASVANGNVAPSGSGPRRRLQRSARRASPWDAPARSTPRA